MAELVDVDTALAALAAKLRGDAQHYTREVGQVARCGRCGTTAPTRRWPLGSRHQLCDSCWLWRVRGEVVEVWSRQGCRVSTVHPQHGELHRGTVRAVGIEARELQPVPVWLVQDQDATVVADRYAGDFMDARARLLDATPWADQLDDNTTDDSRE